jgi:hypothetical protein
MEGIEIEQEERRDSDVKQQRPREKLIKILKSSSGLQKVTVTT